jgi:TetR/AcrR family transcriptional regulator, cholesterol catabolism regulator
MQTNVAHRALDSSAKRPRGRPRKTLEDRDDGNRRQQLLSSAATLFRRKGFGGTSTRDIAAAVGMQSGSPFYHFKSKGALLYAVMEEGMRSAIARQERAISVFTRHEEQASRAADAVKPDAAACLRILIRNHFDVLLGPGSDFIPVMLYEARSITPRQRTSLAQLQSEYEAPWIPVLDALRDCGRLKADVKLARLLMFGALNWSAQWYDRRKGASLDELTDAAIALFLAGSEPPQVNSRGETT